MNVASIGREYNQLKERMQEKLQEADDLKERMEHLAQPLVDELIASGQKEKLEDGWWIKIKRSKNWNKILEKDQDYKEAKTLFETKKGVIIDRLEQEQEPNYNKPTTSFFESNVATHVDVEGN